ncbi:MAG: hypothetical protein GX676_06325 [Bacilli bacterium]|nr:hypothetical protein [Bacilli bacterium]
MKKSGFSYIELLLSLSLMINLFVLLNQMFYQLNNSYNYSSQINKDQIIENYVQHLQYHLNRAATYEITDNQISLSYQDYQLAYTVRYKELRIIYNNVFVQILRDVDSITFTQVYPFIYVRIVESNGVVYEKRIIFIPKT